MSASNASNAVVICECFARDGLQNEPDFVPTDLKRALIERFAELGFTRVEATSYSNPKIVPQFADASELLRRLARREGVFYKATCANLRAVERACADREAGIGVNEISLLVSASEAHTAKNLRSTREDQWRTITDMAAAAIDRFRLVGVVSVALGCPFEGRVDPGVVVDDVARFVDLGVHHVAIGDTTGMGSPRAIRALFQRLMRELPLLVPIAHFHDTRGTGLVNCVAALEAGVHHFDSAFGGVGGHPAKVKYGGGYTGNVCTEDLVNLFESMGVATGIDLDGLLSAAAFCEQALNRSLHGHVTRSGLNPLIAKAASL
ncbi:MAG: hydroxymethylglutaryl-CoA lyase [Burkholderiales bacterium]